MPPAPLAPPPAAIEQAAAALRAARRPVILAGRASRSLAAWDARVGLAEALDAKVVTDLKIGAAFPTDHPLHAGAPGIIAPVSEAAAALRAADVILSLDWVDLAGTLSSVFGAEPPPARIIRVTLDHLLHNGWSMDHQGLPPVDLLLAAEPDTVVPALLAALGAKTAPRGGAAKPPAPAPAAAKGDGAIAVDDLAAALRRAVGSRAVTLTHLPLGWNGASWPFRHPLDYIGSEGGGGIGAGPGVSVGAALALRGSGRLPIAVCGDGDFLMGVTALWTAVHYRIPLLLVVANNRSFFNDEVHQERVARMRARPVENKWIGQRIDDPDIDLAAMGRAQGAVGFGPVTRAGELDAVFAEAIAAVEHGEVAVVDVRVEPGYTPAMTAALTRVAAKTT
jgi:thiamine pyrophosphate-dependent acetolactate synthase large subunit-like protein